MTEHWPFISFLLVAVISAYVTKKLSMAASGAGGLLALVIYYAVGWTGIFLLGTFFLLGTIATGWRKDQKAQKKIVADADSRRTTGQVWANGGMAGLLGLLGALLPEYEPLFLYLMAASFSSAAADTVSSELGSIYGTRFFDILSFQRRHPGADGVVSLEGTLLGVVASGIVALVYSLSTGFEISFLWIVIAGTVGNITDSVLGATLERKGVIGNNAVNFSNTAVAVLAAYLLVRL